MDRLDRIGIPALAGIAAASVAIALSEAVAAAVPGAPSLVIAAGNQVIALQPPGAKEFAVSLFGLNDKLALNVAIVATALGIAAIAAILAARRFRRGAAVFVAFGLVAGLTAAGQPLVDSAFAVLSAASATVAAVATLWLLLRLGRRNAPARGDSMPDWSRRRFVIASAGTIAAAVTVGAAGRFLVERRPSTGVAPGARLPYPLSTVLPLAPGQSLSVPGLTPIVVPNRDFYRIDTALVIPRVDVEAWRLAVDGLVDRPLKLSYDELLDLPLHEQHVTIACVSNRVGGNLVGNALWTGARLKDVLEMAGVQPGADQIIGRSVDGFTAGFPTSWALEPDREPLIAVGMNREPLPPDHGFPARLIVPGLFGYVSATKWLSTIELTTRDAVDGYWVPLGWSKDAPILTQSRIDTPSWGATVAAGLVDIAGVAWAPDRGISRVEVRIDRGPWTPARMSVPIGPATWIQWATTWTATTGKHDIEVRATDGTGEVQTDARSDPAPDGARGRHQIRVNVV